MRKLKKNIAVLELVVFLLPTAILLLHSFENHSHFVCTAKNAHHSHNGQHANDCEICNYNFPNFFVSQFSDFVYIKIYIVSIYLDFYDFQSIHKELYYSLRAPPNFV